MWSLCKRTTCLELVLKLVVKNYEYSHKLINTINTELKMQDDIFYFFKDNY